MNRRKSICWQNRPAEWTMKEYLEAHKEYQVNDTSEDEPYIWTSLIYIGECMGLDRTQIDFLFKKKPDLTFVDLAFYMFLIKLYGTEEITEFYNSKSLHTISDVHKLLHEQEEILLGKGKNSEMMEKLHEAADMLQKNLDVQAGLPDEIKKMTEMMKPILKGMEQNQKQKTAGDVETANVTATASQEVAVPAVIAVGNDIQKLLDSPIVRMLIDNELLSQKIDHREEVHELQSRLQEKERDYTYLLREYEKTKDEMKQHACEKNQHLEYVANIMEEPATTVKKESGETVVPVGMTKPLPEMPISLEDKATLKKTSIFGRKKKRCDAERQDQMDPREGFCIDVLLSDDYSEKFKMVIRFLYEKGYSLEELKKITDSKISEENLDLILSIKQKLSTVE